MIAMPTLRRGSCVTEPGLLERYVHLGITARCCIVHGQGNAVEIQPHHAPCRVPEYHPSSITSVTS
jgi:hypothetical protein